MNELLTVIVCPCEIVKFPDSLDGLRYVWPRYSFFLCVLNKTVIPLYLFKNYFLKFIWKRKRVNSPFCYFTPHMHVTAGFGSSKSMYSEPNSVFPNECYGPTCLSHHLVPLWVHIGRKQELQVDSVLNPELWYGMWASQAMS